MRVLRNRFVRVFGVSVVVSAAAFLLLVWSEVITIRLMGGGAGVMLTYRRQAAVSTWYEPTVGCVVCESVRYPARDRPGELMFRAEVGARNSLEFDKD